MTRTQIALCLLLSAASGGVLVTLLPENAFLPVVFASFLVCIVLGWVLAIQNNGLNLKPSGVFLPIKPFTRVSSSKSLLAFGFAAAFALGECVSMLLAVAYA